MSIIPLGPTTKKLLLVASFGALWEVSSNFEDRKVIATTMDACYGAHLEHEGLDLVVYQQPEDPVELGVLLVGVMSL